MDATTTQGDEAAVRPAEPAGAGPGVVTGAWGEPSAGSGRGGSGLYGQTAVLGVEEEGFPTGGIGLLGGAGLNLAALVSNGGPIRAVVPLHGEEGANVLAQISAAAGACGPCGELTMDAEDGSGWLRLWYALACPVGGEALERALSASSIGRAGFHLGPKVMRVRVGVRQGSG